MKTNKSVRAINSFLREAKTRGDLGPGQYPKAVRAVRSLQRGIFDNDEQQIYLAVEALAQTFVRTTANGDTSRRSKP